LIETGKYNVFELINGSLNIMKEMLKEDLSIENKFKAHSFNYSYKEKLNNYNIYNQNKDENVNKIIEKLNSISPHSNTNIIKTKQNIINKLKNKGYEKFFHFKKIKYLDNNQIEELTQDNNIDITDNDLDKLKAEKMHQINIENYANKINHFHSLFDLVGINFSICNPNSIFLSNICKNIDCTKQLYAVIKL
jgi:hypothetical protein